MDDVAKKERKVQRAYRQLGNIARLYDGMMTNTSWAGRFAIRWLWGFASYPEFLAMVYRGLPQDFAGDLLEVPVGTGVLSFPHYERMKEAHITCLDASDTMLRAAERQAQSFSLGRVDFTLGDVGALQYADESFDFVLSVNGFHAFPEKEKAYRETERVLRRGGTFSGSMYVRGRSRRTDFFVKQFCERRGFFSPPYETEESLRARLEAMYGEVDIVTVGSFAGFLCRKV